MEIKLENVTKSFNSNPVVKHLSFTTGPGQILGLLGPNGAGKTTTLRMILDILKPDEGAITFDKKKINKQIRNRVGYLPEERGIYQKYKVEDILLYFGLLKNLSKRKSQVEAVRLLDRFNMVDVLEKPVSHLSKGMQHKLQFLITLLHDPEILILDEPFWGLDHFNRELVHQKILSLRQEGKVLLLSTHQLNEAELLCDYVVLLNQGQVIRQGTLDRLRKNFREHVFLVESTQDLSKLHQLRNVRKIEIENSRALIYVEEKTPVKKILNEIINLVDITKVEYNKSNLQDIFSQLVNLDTQNKK